MRRVTAGLVVVGIGLLGAGCHGGSHNAKPTTTTTTTTTKPVTPVADGALKGLLLTPEQVNGVMGATEMVVSQYRTEMSDDSSTMAPPECLAVDGAAQAVTYANSGFTAVRDQTLQEGDNFAHFAEQSVVLFPSARQAAAFFAAAVKQWPNCHHYTHTQTGSEWETGAVSNTDGMLSVVATQLDHGDPGWACGRALTAKNNVVIDVNTCSADPANTAVTVAGQIAGKVPMR